MKKSFAKLTALCLAAAVAFGAAGCGKEKKETQQDKNAVAADDTKEDKKTEKAADALQTAVMLADQAPELQAEAAILIEASSGTILYEKKCHPEDVSCQHDKNADRSGGVGLFQAGGFNCGWF